MLNAKNAKEWANSNLFHDLDPPASNQMTVAHYRFKGTTGEDIIDFWKHDIDKKRARIIQA